MMQIEPEQAQALVRAQGMCGALTQDLDVLSVCIRPADHQHPSPVGPSASAASAYFNSLPIAERLKLGPLLEDYRLLGLSEAHTLVKSIERYLGTRQRELRRRLEQKADAEPRDDVGDAAFDPGRLT